MTEKKKKWSILLKVVFIFASILKTNVPLFGRNVHNYNSLFIVKFSARHGNFNQKIAAANTFSVKCFSNKWLMLFTAFQLVKSRELRILFYVDSQRSRNYMRPRFKQVCAISRGSIIQRQICASIYFLPSFIRYELFKKEKGYLLLRQRC